MAGIKGKAGRHKSEVEREGFFFRLRPDVITRVERCTPLLELQEGVRMSKAEALEHLLTMACTAVERASAGTETPAPAQSQISEISDISHAPISKISEISGEDFSVPGYGFPEDEDESLALVSSTNGQEAPASSVTVLQTAETPSAASASLVEQTPSGKRQRSAWNKVPPETLQAIADERTLCDGISYSEFAQRLHAKGIYSATAKDGSKVPASTGRLSELLKRARDAGLL
jgi:hypothetical protein